MSRIALLLLGLAVPGISHAQQPGDVLAKPSAYEGTRVEWLGKQVRTSRIPRNAPAINQRLFVAVDADGREIPTALFVADGVVLETEAAQRIGRTRADDGIRRVRGTVSGTIDTYHNNVRGTPGVLLRRVTLDAR